MLTYGDLPNQTGPDAEQRDLFLFCESCGARYSANRGDYFMAGDNVPIKCSDCNDNPMVLAREICRIEVAYR